MKRLVARLAALAIAILAITPAVAQACSVCSAGQDDATRAAFLGTTALLSVLPLALVGGFVWWIRRRTRALEERGVVPRVRPL